jgi:hypothetical protein
MEFQAERILQTFKGWFASGELGLSMLQYEGRITQAERLEMKDCLGDFDQFVVVTTAIFMKKANAQHKA